MLLEYLIRVKRKAMEMKLDVASTGNLEILKTAVRLDLNMNDLRILVGCMRAVSYQMEIDGEDYLDGDGLALKERLESLYLKMLGQNGNRKNTH
jgi:hypothetical protein